MKQTAVEFYAKELEKLNIRVNGAIQVSAIRIFEQAKQMEKEQITDAFAECWKANVPNGIECKLDAEQYYNETFKSE